VLIRRHRQSGISLIEIMVSVGILGVLMALGMPAFQTWIQNTQIRVASEAVFNGMQTARNEAIRRNAAVQFKLDNGTTSQWRVNLFNDPDGTPLQFRAAEEGSVNAMIAPTPADADTVTFSALGRVVPNADASPSLTRVEVDNPLIPVVADRRKLRILVPAGGSLRLCDPRVTAADPRACP
jgi:type IV fimbrial biogenesis protein FimT